MERREEMIEKRREEKAVKFIVAVMQTLNKNLLISRRKTVHKRSSVSLDVALNVPGSLSLFSILFIFFLLCFIFFLTSTMLNLTSPLKKKIFYVRFTPPSPQLFFFLFATFCTTCFQYLYSKTNTV